MSTTDDKNLLIELLPADRGDVQDSSGPASPRSTLDLAAIRARFSGKKGKEYWRCLEELADTKEFRQILHREFPRQASAWLESMSRREFLKLMGASLALAGITSCSGAPPGKIVPYVRKPEEIIPGIPLFFATAMPLSGYALGLLVESHEGRPTKVEGNPDHPASLGATDAFAQGSVLEMYDPDRSQAVLNLGQIQPYGDFLDELNLLLQTQQSKQGAGLRILTETIASPTLADQLKGILKAYPQAKWHQWEPVNRDNVRAGAQQAFGQIVETTYHFDKADVILALDADFFSFTPGNLRYAHDFMSRRHVTADQKSMNRLYAVESTQTIVGAVADNRLPLRPGDIAAFTTAIASALGVSGAPSAQTPGTVPNNWISAVTRDLQAHKGSSLVIAGEGQPPFVHALVHAINQNLGNVGSTVIYTDPVEANPVDQLASLRDLANDLSGGKVDLLLILGGNPAFTAPADLQFSSLIQKAGTRIHLGLYDNETSALCEWHVPEAHYLESWGDARAFDGTVSIIQPLMAPLYGGRTAHEILGVFSSTPDRSAYEWVRAYWSGQYHGADFESFWRKTVHDGVMSNTALPPKAVSLRPDWAKQAPGTTSPSGGTPGALEIIFRPDPSVYDGRFANNGWLQELPKPLSKVTWDNYATISPAMADRLGVNNEDLVELRYQGRTARAPVWVLPGHADNAVTVTLGYGRTRSGNVGTGAGFNAYDLRTSNALWFDQGVEIRKTGEQYRLANTQRHFLMEGRDLVRATTFEEFQKNPKFAQEGEHEPNPDETLYPPVQYPGNKWGMAIDINTCIGCNACVIACQAENNISVVGKEQVLREREMHWLRIDTYFSGKSIDNPTTYFEPVPCMQCENAPCEVVCPVGATVHSDDGLNDMVYNRCIGTRYCSNNCPYKVRRFNFLQFSDYSTNSLKPLRNPNVTVRERGVMEKCTYCVQRIRAAQIRAEVENNRPLRDGEVLTACQAACPTQAIVFGDINDPNSRVKKLKDQERNYSLLAELNTRPRTTYLAAVRNPNPELS